MSIQKIQSPNEYVEFMQHNADEIEIVFKGLLICDTRFFRDEEAWKLLGERELCKFVEARPEHYSFRAWVAGCATGEEAYTLAILLRASWRKTISDECPPFTTGVGIAGNDSVGHGRRHLKRESQLRESLICPCCLFAATTFLPIDLDALAHGRHPNSISPYMTPSECTCYKREIRQNCF